MERETITITTREFLSAFFADDNETIYLRTIGAKGTSGIIPKKYQITRRTYESDLMTRKALLRTNEDSGVYFVVNSGGNKDQEITRYNAFFVENDDISIEEQHQALDSVPLQPSIRVETQKSVHAYWLIDSDCSELEWRDVQNRLIAYFDGDKSIKNPSRCMRLPSFDHVAYNDTNKKYEFKPVEIKDFDSSRRFTVEEMKNAFPFAEIKNEVQISEVSDDCDNCDDFQPVYENWDDLNAELGIRIMQAGKLNNRGKYEMKCPVHLGKTETSLFFDPTRKTIKCVAGCPHQELLKVFGLPEKPLNDSGFKEQEGTQAALLIALAEECELFVSDKDEAYVTAPVDNHFETWTVKSTAFKSWLAKRFRQLHKKTPAQSSLDEAVESLIGEAIYGDSQQKQVFTRVAELENVVYLDLVNENWEIVKITRDGWEILSDYPVKFRRTKGMK